MIGNIKFIKNYYKDYLKYIIKKEKIKENKIYKDIGILNPSIGTSNLGDKIIFESVYKYLRKIYPVDMFTEFPTQLHHSFDTRKLMNEKDLLFIAGTNLLASNIETRQQWKINNKDVKCLTDKVVLVGVGWWQYQGEINSYTERIYKSILNKEVIHSVRDQYTLKKLNSIGIKNVLNTSCPTLWDITPNKCKRISPFKGSNVVSTLTFYHKNYKLDKKMLEILSGNYERVYLWIQGLQDIDYFNKINDGLGNIELIPPTIEAYDKLLLNTNIDYIGTRLHAGIRALQYEVRSLILAVDNRAIEIGNDVNLNVVPRDKVEKILTFINGKYFTNIKLPIDDINKWINNIKNIK